MTDTIAVRMSEASHPVPVIKYLTEVRQELQRVTWPTRKQTWEKTAIVIAVSIAVGIYIGVLDSLFTRLMTIIIGT